VAFGLTVIPCIIMSSINLLGNILTLSYPTLYLVHSCELEEAKLRGAQIDGVVGKVIELKAEDPWYAINGCFEGLLKCGGEEFRPTLERIPNRKKQDTIHDSILYTLSYKDSLMGAPKGGISFPEYTRFETIGQPYQGPGNSSSSAVLLWGFMAFSLGSILYTVIGGLTRFKAAQSIKAQRVLTMFWLAFRVFIGATMPLYGFSFLEIIHIRRDAFSSENMLITRRRRETEEEEKREIEAV